MDTIFALASARGKSGVAVIRVSGPDAKTALGHMCTIPEPRRAALRRLSYKGDFLDEALVIVFDAPGSFTGEDVVEIHTHGSNASVASVLTALADISGLRQADAGEFTRRALENEQLDLAQIEGLSDLIEAETDAQRRQALRVFSGALGDIAESWRSDLIRAAALLEATIDFADEEVPVDVLPEVKQLIAKVDKGLNAEIAGSRAAERIRDGFEVAIIGPPNIGKSTLLNALAGREAAITSDVAGTTRDVIEVQLDLAGLPVTFLDTAGIRQTDDKVENIGIERATERAERADLRIFLLERSGDEAVLKGHSDDLKLVAKSDINEIGDISALTGHGIDDLIDRVTGVLEQKAAGAGVAIRARHRAAMISASASLNNVNALISSDLAGPEIIAEELRVAIRALDTLVGRVDVEHVLGEIFASFCIGK